MCFYEIKEFRCGHWKWGDFKQHCNREHRLGETCGMKLLFWATLQGTRCSPCTKLDTKLQERQELVEEFKDTRPRGYWGVFIEIEITTTYEEIRHLRDVVNRSRESGIPAELAPFIVQTKRHEERRDLRRSKKDTTRNDKQLGVYVPPRTIKVLQPAKRKIRSFHALSTIHQNWKADTNSRIHKEVREEVILYENLHLIAMLRASSARSLWVRATRGRKFRIGMRTRFGLSIVGLPRKVCGTHCATHL